LFEEKGKLETKGGKKARRCVRADRRPGKGSCPNALVRGGGGRKNTKKRREEENEESLAPQKENGLSGLCPPPGGRKKPPKKRKRTASHPRCANKGNKLSGRHGG